MRHCLTGEGFYLIFSLKKTLVSFSSMFVSLQNFPKKCFWWELGHCQEDPLQLPVFLFGLFSSDGAGHQTQGFIMVSVYSWGTSSTLSVSLFYPLFLFLTHSFSSLPLLSVFCLLPLSSLSPPFLLSFLSCTLFFSLAFLPVPSSLFFLSF